MVTKRLSVLLAIVVALAGIVSACGASASTEPAQRSTSAPCIQNRYGRDCQNYPIVEGPDLVFSADGRNAYLLSSFLPEFPEEERRSISIYDREPATGSLVQKPGTAGCISEGRAKGCQPARGLLDGLASFTVSSDGRNAYAAAGKGVVVFDRDPSSGALSQRAGVEGCIASTRKRPPTCAPARGLPSATEVAVSPDGQNAYVTTPRALVVFDRDPSTGALTQKPGPEGMVLGGAGSDLLVSPDGKNVYVSPAYGPNAILTFDRNPDTGAVTRVPKPAGCISEDGKGGCRRGREFSIYAMAVSPDGRNVYGVGETYPKEGVVLILDRRPNGTLVQKLGRAGCLGGESAKNCVGPASQGELRGLTVSHDGKRVYLFDGFLGSCCPLLRQPSGRLREVPRHRGARALRR